MGFNEEVVVRAIAASAIPVICAVGHETDTTLADFAADLRAPTPTAAAEMAVPVRDELLNQIAELALRKRRCALRPVSLGRERLEARAQRLPRPEALLQAKAQRLDDLSERLRRGLGDRSARARTELHAVSRHLSLPVLRHRTALAAQTLARSGFGAPLLARRIGDARARFAPLDRLIPQLDPRAPLSRGFALVLGSDGHVVAGREAAAALPVMTLEFHDGRIEVGPLDGAPPDRTKPRSQAKPKSARQEDLFR